MDHPGLFTAGGETAAPAEFLAAIQKVLEARRLSLPAGCQCCFSCLTLRCSSPSKLASEMQWSAPESRSNAPLPSTRLAAQKPQKCHMVGSSQSVDRILLSPQDTLRAPPTEEEVELAKAQTINSFVFNFVNSTAQLQRRLVYSLIGLPPVRSQL